MTQNKQRLGQCRAGIKQKTTPCASSLVTKPIQSTGEPILQQPQNTAQLTKRIESFISRV